MDDGTKRRVKMNVKNGRKRGFPPEEEREIKGKEVQEVLS